MKFVTKKMNSYIGHVTWRRLGEVRFDSRHDVPLFIGIMGRVP